VIIGILDFELSANANDSDIGKPRNLSIEEIDGMSKVKIVDRLESP
jgi:hypothetical protein